MISFLLGRFVFLLFSKFFRFLKFLIAKDFVQLILTIPEEPYANKGHNQKPSFYDLAIVCFTPYSANILKNSSFWCIDGTFKYCPKEFNQQFEIMAKNDLTGAYEICVLVYMTRKTETLYLHAFSAIASWFLRKDGQIDFKLERILTDFEKASINAMQQIFKPKLIEGCYFHAVSKWWKHATKNGFI